MKYAFMAAMVAPNRKVYKMLDRFPKEPVEETRAESVACRFSNHDVPGSV